MKTYTITVKGKHKTWSFEFEGNEQYLNEWRSDGLEIDEVIHTIPEWVVRVGLAKLWCYLQDIGVLPV